MPKIGLDSLEQTNRTGYPPPFNEPVAGRWQRKVGEVAGLSRLGRETRHARAWRLVEPAALARG